MNDLVKSSSQFLLSAKSLSVLNQSDRQKATDLWDAIRAFRKQALAQKEQVCSPLKLVWDKAKKPYDSFIKECEHYEEVLEQKMGEYDREVDRQAKLEQSRIQKRIDEQNRKKLEKARETGKEVVLKEVPVVETPAKVMETQAGTTQTRQTRIVYSVKDNTKSLYLLMTDYPELFDLNKTRFNALAKTGKIDGHPSIVKSEEFVYVQRNQSTNKDGGYCE